MRTPFALAVLLALLAVFAAACGGGDDDADTRAAIEDTSVANADVDIDDDDRAYATNLCSAFAGFYDSFDDVAAEVTPGEDEDPFAGFLPIFEDLQDDISGIEPPGRYEDYHDNFLEIFDDVVEGLQSGDEGALEDIDSPEQDVALQARLQAAAQDVEQCQELEDQFGSDLFE